MMGRRKQEGRGALSIIDRLPSECDLDVVWADEELRARKLPQTEILTEFNRRLAEKGIPPISKGSFSRRSVKKAKAFRQIEEERAVAADLAPLLGGDKDGKITILISEMLKLAVYKKLEAGDYTVKELTGLKQVLVGSVDAQIKQIGRANAEIELEERAKKLAALVADGKTKGAAGKLTLAKITELLTTGAG